MPLFETESEEETKAESLVDVIVTKDTSTVYTATGTETAETDFEIEGYTWEGTYYSQLLGPEDSPRRLDLHLSPTLQQYTRINGFVMVADDEPSPSTDNTTITTVEGSGKVYPGTTPNSGDMFVASLRDGKMALFVITHVERQGFYSSSVWDITYQMVDYHNETYQANLDIKVVNELYFDMDSKLCVNGLKSSVSTAAIYDLIGTVVDRWWDEFYDLKAEVAIVPIGSKRYYDHAINKFILEIVPYTLYKNLAKIREYNIPSSTHTKTYNTLWDVMALGKFSQLDFISQEAIILSRESFVSGNVYTGVGYAQIDGVIHPSHQGTLFGAGVIADGAGYIFSKDFYGGNFDEMQEIENIVYQSITGKTIDYDRVKAELVRTLKGDDAVKRFYTLPIILWLLIRLV